METKLKEKHSPEFSEMAINAWEQVIKEKRISIIDNETPPELANLKRLLMLIKHDRSPVIRDLRKEIIKYITNNQKYISGLEMDNYKLVKMYLDLEATYNYHLSRLKIVMKKCSDHFVEMVYKRKNT